MRELLQSNFALKILSLILATLLWFAIESNLHRKTRLSASPFSEDATLDLPCPVAALVTAGSDRPVVITPAEVQVKLAGTPQVLGDLEVTNLAVFVRVPATLKTEELLSVEVRPPASIRLVSISPAQVSVKPAPRQ